MDEIKCPSCAGSRLRKEALFFKVGDKGIADLTEMDIAQLHTWVQGIRSSLSSYPNWGKKNFGSNVVSSLARSSKRECK